MGKKLSKATSKTKQQYDVAQKQAEDDDEDEEEVALARGPLRRNKQQTGETADKIMEQRAQAAAAAKPETPEQGTSKGKIQKQPNVPEEEDTGPS